jgi:hypothetical protein
VGASTGSGPQLRCDTQRVHCTSSRPSSIVAIYRETSITPTPLRSGQAPSQPASTRGAAVPAHRAPGCLAAHLYRPVARRDRGGADSAVRSVLVVRHTPRAWLRIARAKPWPAGRLHRAVRTQCPHPRGNRPHGHIRPRLAPKYRWLVRSVPPYTGRPRRSR